jgi:[ribosomal protein S18]-alanine N-acetyltransferase
MSEILFRPLIEIDLPAVLAIEEASFPSPWSHAAFLHELNNPHSCLTVAEQDGTVIGYLCCWYVADEIQILDVAVHPEHRRKGVGERLLHHALTTGRMRDASSANLEVRRSNVAAIALYEKFGFREVAIRRGYYRDGEDALLMVCSWLSGAKTPE